MDTSTIITYSIRGLIVLLFLIFGARELMLLFQRTDRRMGRGWTRVWAVARATMFEAWAGRVWLLPVLWLGAGLLLILAVRPFDESERIPLYIKMLLSSQETLLLLMMWVMACVSLPRERERKILITNASKPLSRLEIVLGKIVGFSTISALALLVMGLASLVILQVSDMRLRGRALAAYELQKQDFNKTLVTPSEGLKQLSEEGSLFAYNYINVPKDGGMNVGVLAIPRDANQPPIRYFVGGTNEKAIYHFGPRLEAPEFIMPAPPGRRPYFVFYFPCEIMANPPPAKIQLQVTAYASGPSTPQVKQITLDDSFQAYWEPDQPDQLYSTFDNDFNITKDRGLVTIEVTCITPGVYLRVLEGANPDPKTGEVPSGTESNIEFSNRIYEYDQRFPPRTYFPLARPSVRAQEYRQRQQISGLKSGQFDHEQAIYRFSGASLRNVPVDADGMFQLSMQLETDKSDNPQDPTFAGIRVRSIDRTGVPDFEDTRIEVHEKRVWSIKVPAANLGDKDPTKRGDMVVMVYCATPGHAISLIEDSIRIELPQTPFFVNFFKSEAVIFLEAVLLITLSVACSVRVGWPIALFCSGIGYLFGYFVEFIASLQDYGGLGALNYSTFGHNAVLYHFFDTAASYLWLVLGFISILFPNFNQFQPIQYIGTLQNMPWSVLAGNAFDALVFSIPFVALAYLLFRKQELG